MNSVTRRFARKFGSLLRLIGASPSKPLSAQPGLEARLKAAIEALPASVTAPKTAELWVTKIGGVGTNNVIVSASKRPSLRTKFVAIGEPKGNILFLGEGANPPDQLRLEGDDNIAILSDGVTWSRLKLRFVADNGTIAIGPKSIFNGTELIVAGEGRKILLGDHSLFASGTVVRTSDMHAISNQSTGEWINPPEDVVSEPYVWVGEDASILKGVKIGGGSVIGAKSLVNIDIARFTVAAGVPAKPIKTNIYWNIERIPRKEQLEIVSQRLQELD